MILSYLNSTDVLKSTCHVAGTGVSTGVEAAAVPVTELAAGRGIQTSGQATEKGAVTRECVVLLDLQEGRLLQPWGPGDVFLDEVTLKLRSKGGQRLFRGKVE